ncbi:divergent PAP2 family protein [Citrobacter sp. RHBSTW-00271]|uniref:divergent PAP2 family protein n=1 Tax=Citrobacter sp. RHBSTW-00271 TaxID=2742642 RepID=UPI0015F832EF|nr:divergent PAP2 family protein [Citrobacter sp. RHBSTW-00271]MBA7944155.1 divergent PAP2 family protein [Citrobacter sp. RHBSTW-00271]
MDFVYCITPFVAWFFTGITKFIINSIREGQFAFKNIGYGGFPSNHASIMTSMTSLIGFQHGISNPLFGLAITITFIVMLDANSLRQQIGKHAQTINSIVHTAKLRERIGHTKLELLGGVIVGGVIGYLMHLIINISI